MRWPVLLSLCLSTSAAAAQDTFTQKPGVAPAITAGKLPKADEAPKDDWSARFAAGPTPLWIWGANANEDYALQKSFDAKGIKAARLIVSCDNRLTLHLNQKTIVTANEWQQPTEVDVTRLLKEKGNFIDARVHNDGGIAALVLKLVLVPEKGEPIYIVSDESWIADADKDRIADQKPAKRIAKYGDGPWGKIFDTAAVQGSRVPANTFVTLPGFRVEKLFTVPKDELGSWVCITSDDRGRLIASDQGKLGLVRITPGKVGSDEETKVEKIPANITAAQGLLWHDGKLYVVCNGGPGSGLYRVTSSKNNDVLDTVEKLKALQGGGEHGPHAVRLAPDGKSLYVICGNHTKPPEGFTSRVPKNWGEDHLLPRQWDANGHARGILAPGGYVAKTDFDGKNWEIFTSGYRNPYDFAFNADGEMFVYDADMEWDMGMPWYRPTRVCHATSGSEFGWRSGTGKWPSYYLDSLPAMIDIGPGSPVGVEFGYGAKFPAKYQKTLYICDWTFGTMYAIHTEPDGSTYKATKEEFLSRTPLPLTDVCINPADGAMYFTIGGRGAQSELYRVTYVGKEPMQKVEYKDQRDQGERELRKRFESFHRPGDLPPGAANMALVCLERPDRFVRYAARVALEHQPPKTWQDNALEERGLSLFEAMVALARQGDKSLQPRVLAALDKLTDIDKLPEQMQLDLLRAYQLVFIRMGEPDKETAAKLDAKFEPLFPSNSDNVNRELVHLLVYLKSPTIVAEVCEQLKQPSKPLTTRGLEELILRNRGYGGTVANVMKNSADQQKLAYLFALRNATVGWNLDRWKVYFGFLNEARTKSGGSSYQKFLNNIESDAFANTTDADRLAIEAAGLRQPYKPKVLPKPIGPGRAWSTADIVSLESKLKTGRNYKNGERAFAAARCVVCHRFAGDGGATGPDLSQVAGRFSLKDLAEALVEPSKVVSDQYKASIVRTIDGKTITGCIVAEANGKLVIVTDPEDSTKVAEIAKGDVESAAASSISLMPDKLLDSLNENEVLDLLAYMLSRGDPRDPMFRR